MSIAQAMLQLAIGVSFGLLLFLLASGFTLTFGLGRFVNLTHGAVFMVSAYVATSFAGRGSFLVAVVAAGVVGVVLSLVVYGVTLLRWSTLANNELSQVLLTFGLVLVFAEVARVLWDGLPRALPAPGFASGSWDLAGVSFPAYRVLMGAVALGLAALLWFVQERTRFGAMVRAGVDDREMLEATGVGAVPLFGAVFALSGLLAGIAGGIGAPVLGASIGQEFGVLVLAFVIVVLGGAGSLKGAFAASLAVGVADAFGKALLPVFAEFTMMALVVVVLAWRPEGIFGGAR
ncbi:branched-chain amino acid ABC transporter permease [Actinophytocola sp.]|uniref:branched-chain amino acid ABC transporter permease n=1 Tax=Actinophytocola sp. TaxID=1872138 RepID=UPI003D6B27E1